MNATTSAARLAEMLERQRIARTQTRGDLVRTTGLSYQSLQKILEGRADFRVSSLLALAHALGLEVALVPAALGTAMPVGATAAPAAAPMTDGAPASAVAAALARLRPPPVDAAPPPARRRTPGKGRP
ncbi:helix-turn-helix domain-containing protein [Xylophilus ampelinus]|uniref:HTH cro/C1-type domain-containing protein n=1 Tax=Xylophilus ampelinus TaxID=54067 RepID=A0A318SZV1_9BURK|nr:helix-turn-helix domain-containing protein [Xylophilus ampelinus]MCS4509781.1 hypothetical protein [Xylophilus ampelinus]PYE78691.1 hypothetical protein DFQ15_10550 [Xylophilus ampelinus]